MLRQDNGQYACIAEDEMRYNLGEAKEEMMAAMGLDTEEEGSAMQFLRRGYKVRHIGAWKNRGHSSWQHFPGLLPHHDAFHGPENAYELT